jgi:hypothetical protein
MFSRISQDMGIFTVSMDYDPIAVEQNYSCVKKNGEKNLLPLWMDLVNPTPSIGWQNKERISLLSRRPAGCCMALALIHHLAIGSNIPFHHLAKFFAETSRYLIIEFIPKQDKMVKALLSYRRDIFDGYNLPSFEKEFRKFFRIVHKSQVRDSGRIIYLLKTNDNQ